jgi:hypothetical protein
MTTRVPKMRARIVCSSELPSALDAVAVIDVLPNPMTNGMSAVVALSGRI